ncbi:hypothetical protein KCTCHS21_32410 [Cohnella abietis]|uniref:Uncharacterized protein n=2 Tax=Cohnella abietis TaxID=2507935 RepID=A0A3T1D6Y7_9BACL|nr:hypothetical protein KCTCHS21_32410 [Cohnella abietis]
MSNSLMPQYAYSGEPYGRLPTVTDDRQMMPHPILLEARQTAPNQILLMYDQQTDLASATNISNYWIRSNVGPVGIASVGMGEAISPANLIRPELGMISPVDNSKTRFVMTFRVNAMTGVLYVVLPCFVNLEGRSGYGGANWGPFSRNVFIGM